MMFEQLMVKFGLRKETNVLLTERSEIEALEQRVGGLRTLARVTTPKNLTEIQRWTTLVVHKDVEFSTARINTLARILRALKNLSLYVPKLTQEADQLRHQINLITKDYAALERSVKRNDVRVANTARIAVIKRHVKRYPHNDTIQQNFVEAQAGLEKFRRMHARFLSDVSKGESVEESHFASAQFPDDSSLQAAAKELGKLTKGVTARRSTAKNASDVINACIPSVKIILSGIGQVESTRKIIEGACNGIVQDIERLKLESGEINAQWFLVQGQFKGVISMMKTARGKSVVAGKDRNAKKYSAKFAEAIDLVISSGDKLLTSSKRQLSRLDVASPNPKTFALVSIKWEDFDKFHRGTKKDLFVSGTFLDEYLHALKMLDTILWRGSGEGFLEKAERKARFGMMSDTDLIGLEKLHQIIQLKLTGHDDRFKPGDLKLFFNSSIVSMANDFLKETPGEARTIQSLSELSSSEVKGFKRSVRQRNNWSQKSNGDVRQFIIRLSRLASSRDGHPVFTFNDFLKKNKKSLLDDIKKIYVS